MNDESMSALLDGECSPQERDQLLTQIEQDPALRQRYARMVKARQVRRSALARPVTVPDDFADQVLAALPARPDPVPTPLGEVFPWQPAAGLAAAAALGAVAVLALQTVNPPAPATRAATAVTPPASDTAAVAKLDDANARQLRTYVMAYSHSRGQHGLGGTLGYARYAAYTVGNDDPKGGSR
jgi:negative regulator of sigma E activity